MELVKTHENVPLKAIPEKKLDDLLIEHFVVWLSDLLSLTEEGSAKKIEVALPALKQHCWSMGILEIKQMFEMYADNKLSIKPTPNYFDRILLGKVVEAYRAQKPVSKPKMIERTISDDEKEKLIYKGVINCFEQFLQDRKIIVGYTWVYGHLFDDLKLKSFTKEEKLKAMQKAKANKEKSNLFQKVTESEHDVKNRAKRILLKQYFKSLESQELHIKDLL